MSISRNHTHHDDVDRRYRAKVIILMVAGCLALWGAVGFVAIRIL